MLFRSNRREFEVRLAHCLKMAHENNVQHVFCYLDLEKLWSVVASSTEKPLEHIGVYLGSLADFGALVPDSTTKAKGAEAVTWKLVRAETDKLWIGCSYVGTTAILLREIDSGIAKCVVSYDLLPSGKRQRVNSVTCR